MSAFLIRVTRWYVATTVALIGLLLPGIASAFIIFGAGGSPPSNQYWFIQCQDGLIVGPYATHPEAFSLAAAICQGHGGVADISDSDITNALDLVSCSDPSSVIVGQDLGGGSYNTYTEQAFLAMAAERQGNPQELVGYELLSVIVRGVELHPNANQSNDRISINAIYSDEDESGGEVGGVCGCTPVPMPRSLAPTLAIVLFGTGAAISLRAARRKSRAVAGAVSSEILSNVVDRA